MLKSWILIFFLFAFAAFLKYITPIFKGKMGEVEVGLVLSQLPSESYQIFNNVMLRKDDSETTQIDHIVVSKYGVFVIETKNYLGWIIGNEYKDQWTQNIYGNKNKFYNPIRQNYGHIKTLGKLLGLDDSKFISIVCFSDDATLKVQAKSKVVQVSSLGKTIKQCQEVLLTDLDVAKANRLILSSNIEDRAVSKEHVKQVKQKQAEKKQQPISEKAKENTCPKCGAKLVRKKGKYGYFMACSAYPKCKYIAK